jgi:predicted permease
MVIYPAIKSCLLLKNLTVKVLKHVVIKLTTPSQIVESFAETILLGSVTPAFISVTILFEYIVNTLAADYWQYIVAKRAIKVDFQYFLPKTASKNGNF